MTAQTMTARPVTALPMTAGATAAAAPLAWGRRYAAVRPDHFRVDYVINPYMHLDDQPRVELAVRQWTDLVSTLRALGASVEVIEQRADAPDMVYAMNLGLAVSGPDGSRAVLSHMRYPQRRVETG